MVARANWKLGKSSTEKASLRSNNSFMTFDRSVKNNRYINESLVTILKRLAAGGFLKNNRQWIDYNWSRDPGFFQIILSMNNLEKVNLVCNLTQTEDLQQLFRSCPTLTDLRVGLFDPNQVERERFEQMNEETKNELRSGFQRLRLLKLYWYIDLCPEIQEILTQVQ